MYPGMLQGGSEPYLDIWAVDHLEALMIAEDTLSTHQVQSIDTISGLCRNLSPSSSRHLAHRYPGSTWGHSQAQSTRVDTSTVRGWAPKAGTLAPLRWTFVTSLPGFHLCLVLSPWLSSGTPSLSEIWLHTSPLRLDQSEHSIPQWLALKEHLNQTGPMRTKTFAWTMGKGQLSFCCDAKLADCALRAAGKHSTSPQRGAEPKANTEKGSTERWRDGGPHDTTGKPGYSCTWSWTHPNLPKLLFLVSLFSFSLCVDMFTYCSS